MNSSRRMLAATGLFAVLSLVAAPSAFSGSNPPTDIQAKRGDVFDKSVYSQPADTAAFLTVLSAGTHNVTADANGPDGKPLFRSEDVTYTPAPGPAPPPSRDVLGTEFLTPGSYPFHCTIHPATMGATLVVTGGSPHPRPRLSLKVRPASIRKVARSGALRVEATSTGYINLFPSYFEPEVRLTVKLGGKTVASGGIPHLAGATEANPVPHGAITLRLSKSARRSLKQRESAKLKLTGTEDFAEPVTTTAKLK